MHRFLSADALHAIMEHEKIAETESRPRVSTKPNRTRTLQARKRNLGVGTIALTDTIVTRVDGTQYVIPMGTRKRTKTTVVVTEQRHRVTSANLPAIGDSNH